VGILGNARADRILDHFAMDPTTSTRRAGLELGICHQTVFNTLKADGQHPYHYCRVQEVLPNDHFARIEFCNWFGNQCGVDPNFPEKILWTDEANFTRMGIFNQHNSHVWAHENPYATRVDSYQYEFQVNVWAGIWNNVSS